MPAVAGGATTSYVLDGELGRSVIGAPDATVRALLEDATGRPSLQLTTLIPQRAPFTTTLIPRDRLTRGVAGALLPDDGGVFAYATLRKPMPRVRAFVRTAGKNGRAVTISDRAHSARVSEVTASASGAAAVLFFQRTSRTSREVMRYAIRGAGADARFGNPVPIPADAFSQVAYNDAGDGVIVEQVNGDGRAPAVAVRRIARDGSVGPRIVVDGDHPDGASANAAVAPDGTIALLWSAFDDSLPLRWTTIAPGASSARPIQTVLTAAGDSSSTRVVWAGDRWVATYAGRQTDASTITVAEAPLDGAMTTARTYSPGAGYDGSPLNVALIAHPGGTGADLVWIAGTAASARTLRAHRAAAGVWGEPEVLSEGSVPPTIWTAAPRASGGIALVERTSVSDDPAQPDVTTTSLILTDD